MTEMFDPVFAALSQAVSLRAPKTGCAEPCFTGVMHGGSSAADAVFGAGLGTTKAAADRGVFKIPARQTAITTELGEVIGGSAVLQ